MMAFSISITNDADRQFSALTAHDQRIVGDAISIKLANEPSTPTKAIKRLRPNPVAEYELRVRDFRVLYNVNEEDKSVLILLIGCKQVNQLIVEGEAFHGHESGPSS